MFDFLEPVGLDIVTKALHGGFDVADPDFILTLLVKGLERIPGRCKAQQT